MDRVLRNYSKSSAILKNPCPKSTLNQLYEQRHETGDIKFIIESEEIPAHRYILAALSPKYKAQFYGPMSEKDVINVNDVSPAAFKEFLQFFYMDEVTLTLENIEDVLNLAKQSLVDELVTECTDFLFDVVGMDKLVWFYRLALDYDIKPLEEFCVKQIGVNMQNVFQTPDFLSCEQEMLSQILDLDSLNCNETDVFDACISWAQAKYKQDGIDAATTANLRTALGDAIFKIRFCSMTADQFAAIVKKYSGFLSAQELSEICLVITLKANGEISSIFGENNSIPRKSIESILECSFAKGSPIKIVSPFKEDGIRFSCDRAIKLSGFVICNRIDGDIIVYVNIHGVPQIFEHIKSISDNETRIIFDDPIQVEANEGCYVGIKFDGFENLGWHGFKIECSVEQNDVSFQFAEKYWNYINVITRLLYINAID